MDQVIVSVYGQLLAALAKMEAMKLDNEIRRMQGSDTFNYSPQSFFDLSEEIQSITNQLYR
jgi:hypothetical protein